MVQWMKQVTRNETMLPCHLWSQRPPEDAVSLPAEPLIVTASSERHRQNPPAKRRQISAIQA
jgi:hypothetical protein